MQSKQTNWWIDVKRIDVLGHKFAWTSWWSWNFRGAWVVKRILMEVNNDLQWEANHQSCGVNTIGVNKMSVQV